MIHRVTFPFEPDSPTAASDAAITPAALLVIVSAAGTRSLALHLSGREKCFPESNSLRRADGQRDNKKGRLWESAFLKI